MTPPKTITILSDNNVLEYVETLLPKPKGENIYIYVYKKSITKKGTLLGLNGEDLEKLVKHNTP